MNRNAAREVLAALERFGVRYVVFGGAALNLHGLARFTVRLKDWSDAAALERHFAIEDE